MMVVVVVMVVVLDYHTFSLTFPIPHTSLPPFSLPSVPQWVSGVVGEGVGGVSGRERDVGVRGETGVWGVRV